MEFARKEVGKATGQDFLVIAARSSELDATNQLLNNGAQLSNIRLTPPVFLWA